MGNNENIYIKVFLHYVAIPYAKRLRAHKKFFTQCVDCDDDSAYLVLSRRLVTVCRFFCVGIVLAQVGTHEAKPGINGCSPH